MGELPAAVKSTKHHLRRIIGEQVLTFVELSTLLCKIEACLNSRPLAAISDDPSDLQPLSPAHILIQRSSFLVPEPDLIDQNIPIGRRWQLISQMAQHFWQRWSMEYITLLHHRQKWLNNQRSIQINDLVLVKNEISPPAQWPLVRVIDVHPGKDDLPRLVTLCTATMVLKRPLVKLVL